MDFSKKSGMMNPINESDEDDEEIKPITNFQNDNINSVLNLDHAGIYLK